MRVDWARSTLDLKWPPFDVHDHHSRCGLEVKPAPAEFKFTALALYNLTSNIVHTLNFWLSNSSECKAPANLTGATVLANAADRAKYAMGKSLLRKARGLTGKPRELVNALSKMISSRDSKTVDLDPISIHIFPVDPMKPAGGWMALVVPHTWELWGATTYLCHGAVASVHEVFGGKRTHPCIAELSFKPLIPQLHHAFIGPNEYLDNNHRTSPWFVMLVESCMAVAIIVVATMLGLLCFSAVVHLCGRDKQKRQKKRWLQGQATTSVGAYVKSMVLLVGFYITAQIAVDDILDMFWSISAYHSYILIGCPSMIFGLAVHGTYRTFKLGLAHEECLDTDFRLLELPCRPLHQSVTGRLCLGLVLVAHIAFFAAAWDAWSTGQGTYAGLTKLMVIYLGLMLWCLWQLVKNRETRRRWYLLTIESTTVEDDAAVGRRRTDHMVAGHQHAMPPATVFRPQRLMRGRALKELAARTIALSMFSIGMFVCGIGSLDRLQKEASLHDCSLSTGFMTMPFLHDAHVRTIYVDWSAENLQIQCLSDSLTKAIKLTVRQYPLEVPIEIDMKVIPSAGINPSFAVEVPLKSGPWPAKLELQTDGYAPQHYILYVLRIDTAVQLELNASFNNGQRNANFTETRRLDYQRSHSMWYLPKLTGTPRLHMKATSIVLAPLFSDVHEHSKGNVILGETCGGCTLDVPGTGSRCGLVRDNVSNAKEDPRCIFVQKPIEELESIPAQRLPSHERLLGFLQRSAGHGASLCMSRRQCARLEPLNEMQTPKTRLSQYFQTRLAVDHWDDPPSGLLLMAGKYDLSVDHLQHAVKLELVAHAPPPRTLARLSSDAGRASLVKDGQFITERFEEKELSYTLCYKPGTAFHNVLDPDKSADDERFRAVCEVEEEQTVTYDVCPGVPRKPAQVQFISMRRTSPCNEAWCKSYQRRSGEFGSDYRLVHELMPTARCAVAAVKYQDPEISLWFSACANTTSKGFTALMVASAHGSIRAVELQLTRAKANPNLQNRRGTALHLAAKNGHAEVIQILVQHRAELERRDSFGRRPLHSAIKSSSSKGVAALLRAGANVEAAIKKPWSQVPSLLYAVYEGHISIAKLLLDAGADVHHVGGRDHHPPLIVAGKTGGKYSGKTNGMLGLLLDYRADINYRDEKRGDTVLHWACRRCLRESVLQLLVNRSSDVLARNKDRMTPMQMFEKYCDKDRAALVRTIILGPARNILQGPANHTRGMNNSRIQAMARLSQSEIRLSFPNDPAGREERLHRLLH
mmetsp:Transcript_11117/g.21504  ORF Transcript_11117/g.21504 Transcript_11117/m.21504 type:complete len:1264 (+) Transcript_11117:34-3825(+)